MTTGFVLDIIVILATGGGVTSASASTSKVRIYGTTISREERTFEGYLGVNISKRGSITLESLSWNIF